MNFILPNGPSKDKVRYMCEYMSANGLVFERLGLDDSSPYAILMGGTTVSYRTRSKWGEKGIVFFCNTYDKNNLKNISGAKVYDNSEKSRPYTVFIPDSKFENAVQCLCNNADNKRKVKFVYKSDSNSSRSYRSPSSKSKAKHRGTGLLKAAFELGSIFDHKRRPICGVKRNKKDK